MINQLTILVIVLSFKGMAQTISSSPDSIRQKFSHALGTITPTRETPVHDPVMIKQNDRYYIFCTGNGISEFSSNDMKNWKRERPVFSTTPSWVTQSIPSFKGTGMWAPDIQFHDGKYYLYYAVSVFGKNTSCIGVAVNKTLDPASVDYKWEDMGKVIQSVPGRDMWNAIDPNLVFDDRDTPWLTFGSFWEGIKLVKLNTTLTSVAQPEQWYTIASRPRDVNTPDSSAGNAAIEGPFIFRKKGFYYLFVSWDYCCRGEKSDYKVVVGRSRKVTGPYLDNNGVDLAKNGGTLVVQGDNKEWYGAGHNSAYTFDNKDYLVYHGYDAKDKGRSKLIINEINWVDGWPQVKINQ